ncbi:MAG: apolipoprotein N-acyltransferase [Ruminococcaceae bacterium]|nr:apolipoprotein N-acyltransferase [Oscillospiraceae bacterium]
MKKYMNFLLCFASGAATGACLMLPSLGFLVFATAVPAFAILRKHLKIRYCLTFVLALCMVGYFPAFSIDAGFDPQTNFSLNLAVFAIICLVHGTVLTFALFMGLRLPSQKYLRPLYVALLWAGAEWLLGYGAFAWPTLRLSLAIWKYPFLFGSARFFGQLFVSAVIIAVNYLLSRAIGCKTTKAASKAASVALVVFILNIVCPLFFPSAEKADTSVALVQTGYNLVDGYSQSEISRKSRELADIAAKTNPDLIVLPESSVPGTFAKGEPTNLYPWGEVSFTAKGSMLACGLRNNHSVVYHFTPEGNLTDMRKKLLEVPFFENGVNAPFRWTSEPPEPPIEAKSGKLGIMICYESMFSSFARTHALNGAEAFCVVTNDCWFATPLAQNLHLAHGVYRAVESGRYLVQSALNGATAIIDSDGKVLAHLETGNPGILYGKVSMKPVDTLYLLWGDWWLGVGLIVIATLSIITKCRKKSVQEIS